MSSERTEVEQDEQRREHLPEQKARENEPTHRRFQVPGTNQPRAPTTAKKREKTKKADAQRAHDKVGIKADEVVDGAGGEDHPDKERHAKHLRLLPPPEGQGD